MTTNIQHIIHTHQHKIFKTCLGFTGNVEEAKDLVQEVCINLWLGLDTFRADANISTWIYRITVNTCLMYQRKKHLPTEALSAEKAATIADENVEKKEDLDLKLLRQFITKLPEKERVIIILHLENLSYDEIAEVVGISSNYIGVKLNRIKKTLTKKFHHHGRFKINLE